MAKKKVEDVAEVVEAKGGDDILKHFDKTFGEGVFMSAEDFLDKPKQIIPFAPKIDAALNGGIPEGSVVLCSGQPKTGKTTSTLSFCATAQRPEFGEREVYYFDVEGRLKHMNLNGIKGLNPKKFKIIRSTPEKIMSAEDFLNAAVHILTTKRNCVVVLDSSSALCASKEQIGEVTGSARNDGPKLLASFFRKIGNIINVTNNILWIMQHLIANTSGYGEAYREDGGQKAQYQADVKLRVKWSEAWKPTKADDAPQIGQQIHWKIITSALGGLPNQDSETFIRYGIGIDDIKEYQDLAKSLGIIVQTGAWYKFKPDPKEEDSYIYNLQGEEKMYQALSANPAMFAELKQEVDAILKP
jgi:recombination protein RecA